MVEFKKAVKEESTLRLALIAQSGGGKTWTALVLATRIAKRMGKRVALLDTEHGSARKYSDVFDFDHAMLTSFAPERYIEAIKDAVKAGYGVLVIDSLSHAWAGKDGILEYVDKAKLSSSKGDGFSVWGKATPKHNALVETLLACEGRIHLICTMRSKMETIRDTDESGKTRIRKIGLQPIQRDGLEYEFDLVGDLDQSNDLTISKSRCRFVPPGTVISKPSEALADTLFDWVTAGEKAATPLVAPPVAAPLREPGDDTGEEDSFGLTPDSDLAPFEQQTPVTQAQVKILVDAARKGGLKRAEFQAILARVTGREIAEAAQLLPREFDEVLKAVTAAVVEKDKKVAF